MELFAVTKKWFSKSRKQDNLKAVMKWKFIEEYGMTHFGGREDTCG